MITPCNASAEEIKTHHTSSLTNWRKTATSLHKAVEMNLEKKSSMPTNKAHSLLKSLQGSDSHNKKKMLRLMISKRNYKPNSLKFQGETQCKTKSLRNI